MKTLWLTWLVPLLACVAACGGSVDCEGDACAAGSSSQGPGGAGGQGAGGQDGGGGECSIDAPGTPFTFHVHNATGSMIWLARGCGGTIPIEVQTADGLQGIGPGSGDFCEVSCDTVYQGHPVSGCSDCGPGVYNDLAVDATIDIAWDRRVFVPHMAPEACAGSPGTNSCALGVAVAPSAMQDGLLVACKAESFGGGCATEDQMMVTFTVDTNQNEATLEVK